MDSAEHKVIVIGADQVGKTSLIQRYLFNDFNEEVPQTSPEEKRTVKLEDGKAVHLVICDMKGTSKYRVTLAS